MTLSGPHRDDLAAGVAGAAAAAGVAGAAAAAGATALNSSTLILSLPIFRSECTQVHFMTLTIFLRCDVEKEIHL